MGGTGYFGRHIGDALDRHGHSALAVARGGVEPGPNQSFRAIDVAAAAPELIAELLTEERIDVVVNVTGGWGTTEEEMLYSHTRLVEQLVDAVALMPSRPRLVHIGTIHEYGPVPEGTLIDESIVPAPETLYAKTKHAGSEAVLRATRGGRVDGVVLRSVNTCGPYPPAPSFLGFVCTKLRDAAAEGTDVELTIADAQRDYLDVRDAAEAVVLATGASATPPVMNIGRSEAVEMRDLIGMLITASGFPTDRVRLRGGPVNSKGGDWTRAGTRLVERVLGWRPRISLPESMRAMWESVSP
jgi:nucleoside-diphosphate-sugar epimerase